MDKGFFDEVTDELKNAMQEVRGEVRNMFKNKKPYRMVKMSDDEVIREYSLLDDDVKDRLRNTSPEWSEHEDKVRKLIMRRYGHGL